MTTEVRWRRGTTAQHATFTGANAEITVDTTKKTLVVHDGVTAGGFPVASGADITAAVASRQATSEKGQPNGYAGLGSDGKVPAAQLPASSAPSLLRAISGLDPEKMSTNVLRIYPGSLSNSDGTGYFSTSTSIDITLTTVGVNGLDTGAIVDNTDYFVYMIANNTTRVLAAVVSAALFYGDVVVPSGYSLVRKLPWGFVYRAAWDGIPDFHLAHWPKPYTSYTGVESGSPYIALSNGTATTFTDVSLANFIPDNSRLIRLHINVSSVGTAGTAYIRVLGSSATGLAVGGSNPASGVESYMTLDFRVTSDLKIQYKVTGGARLTLIPMGYSQTEPV